MKTRMLKFLALLLVVCFAVGAVPMVANQEASAALTVNIDSINGSKAVSGSYIWTTGTFNATYWVAISAQYVSYNVYTVKAIYNSGDTKSITVSGSDILLVVHMDHAQYSNAVQIALGDVLTLYNMDLSSGTCSNGYVRVSSSFGLTISEASGLKIDYSTKVISGLGVGSTVAALKTHICEATDELVVKNASGVTVSGNAVIGTGYTVQSASSGAYKLEVSGDLNGDTTCDSTDYMFITNELISGSSGYSAKSDVNGDGDVTSADIAAIKMKVKGAGNVIIAPISVIAKTEPEDIVIPKSTLNYHSVTYKLSDVSGTHSGTAMSNGKLTLASGSTSGTFTTNTLNIGTFSKMVASWNAVTNGGKVSLAVSFELTTGTWSSYHSWGTWSSTSGVSASASPSTTHASVDVDILSVKSGYTPTGNIKVRLTLTQYNGGIPVVRNFSIATPQMAAKRTVNTSALPTYYLNDVPMRSQLASANGSIGNIICSPTSTAMALEYLGTKVTSLTAAYGIYDNNWQAYGNWAFACAYAGEKGYVAYLDFYDSNMLKYALSQGCTVACSTSLTSAGHIVLVTGYKVVNGVEYFIVNDPNVNQYNVVRTDYTLSYFESVWRRSDRGGFGLVYVFQGVEDLNQR